MAHVHTHAHDGSRRRLVLSIGLNLLISVAEIVGGLLAGSLALLSDAVHNLNDTASLVVSYVARRLTHRRPSARKTFGYRRAEIVGAFVNLVTLVVIALFLVKEAIDRLLAPQPIDAPVMLTVATIGLVANVLTAVLLHRDAHSSLNIRSAFLHIVSDAVSSVAVILGGVAILLWGAYWVDPVITIGIAVYIALLSLKLLRQTTHILMEGTPENLDPRHIAADLRQMAHVRDVHHVHIWQLDEHHLAFEAHVVVDEADLPRMEQIKRALKQRLREQYGIGHVTLEFESHPCCEEASAPPCHDPLPARR
ncbi:cation diffusion facilitator family transporter [Rhodothermus marinus]|uniref:cation diffusion facilitator family transporter n=1 Tax=Rhodothermus marinus TaxID=29549 RepID=UPI0006D22A23|nr:cation diffusion facilitator family transporter [Rhodothermus marinus]